MSSSTDSTQLSNQISPFSMRSALVRSELQKVTSKFEYHLMTQSAHHETPVTPPPILGTDKSHVGNIIDTSMPHTPWMLTTPPATDTIATTEPVHPIDDLSTIKVPLSTTEPVSPIDSASDENEPPIVCGIPPGVHPYEPSPVGVHLDDGGFTISINNEGTIFCGNPSVQDPLMPSVPPIDIKEGSYIIPPIDNDVWHTLLPVPVAPSTPAPTITVEHLFDGGFTVYLDDEGNAVCGTPPNPLQSAINDFVAGDKPDQAPGIHYSTDLPPLPTSFADVHTSLDLTKNTDTI